MSMEENSRRVYKVHSSPYFFIPFPACKTVMNLPPGESQRRERSAKKFTSRKDTVTVACEA